MRIRVQRSNPDGLDEVFAAYQALRRIFEAAEEVVIPIDETSADVLLRLPGSGEMVDPNDLNPLNGLEQWLAQECIKRGIAQ